VVDTAEIPVVAAAVPTDEPHEVES
jgi:hypothetical protein